MNHKGTFHFYKYPLPLPHPASLDLTTSSRRWRMRYGISGLAGNTGLTRSTVLRHDLGGGGNLPRNPGAPNDEVSLAGMEVDLVMLLPLQIIVVNEQILRKKKLTSLQWMASPPLSCVSLETWKAFETFYINLLFHLMSPINNVF